MRNIDIRSEIKILFTKPYGDVGSELETLTSSNPTISTGLGKNKFYF
jgi:hypothetical protein